MYSPKSLEQCHTLSLNYCYSFMVSFLSTKDGANTNRLLSQEYQHFTLELSFFTNISLYLKKIPSIYKNQMQKLCPNLNDMEIVPVALQYCPWQQLRQVDWKLILQQVAEHLMKSFTSVSIYSSFDKKKHISHTDT